jgi:hypothetical protein
LNFFCEKHGKNSRDTHFSQVSKFLQFESFAKKILSSKDLVDAINNRQNCANENSILTSKQFFFTEFSFAQNK